MIITAYMILVNDSSAFRSSFGTTYITMTVEQSAISLSVSRTTSELLEQSSNRVLRATQMDDFDLCYS